MPIPQLLHIPLQDPSPLPSPRLGEKDRNGDPLHMILGLICISAQNYNNSRCEGG